MTGLTVARLQVSHFRSHLGAVVVADGRPVAIHGPNGAGKTNLLEAVSLLSPGRGFRRAGPDDLVRRPEALGWRVFAEVTDGRALTEIVTGAEAGAARSVQIDGKAATQTALASILRVLWLVPAMDRLWIEGADGRRRFLDRATLSFVPDHAEATLRYDKAMRERNRLLKDGVRDPHWYAALEDAMAVAGAVVQGNRRTAVAALTAAQAGAATVFPTATLTLVDPADAEGADALRDAYARGRARDLAAGRTLSGPHRSDLEAIYADKGVAARDCSTGEQKALLISLILANARALAAATGRAPVLLLDEVAAHLDTARRAALYDEICALGAQAWMTGTERALFDTLGNRAQYLSVTDAGGTSTVTAEEVP
ncbi:DNA replication and repair protein RecF [Loktanella fryxellensis]|uniref:DNA replication and repair protein RecF n=1 Tax=Loktanella fryxellensis TaxID=245187 RepID=A0A1H7ZSF6_9RHOB|nr:DNA replication/repair protein RecF [Loktanella fryxellensis]SEM61213.1 DNA replication and repair protein RecF [Loktanella fryxellensis]